MASQKHPRAQHKGNSSFSPSSTTSTTRKGRGRTRSSQASTNAPLPKEKRLSQYYTAPAYAKEAFGKICAVLEGRGEDWHALSWIEPAAGKGVFVDAAKERGLTVTAIDIDPQAEGIEKADFFTWTPADGLSWENRIIFGNFPFGKNGKTSTAFINHAAGFARYVVSILPNAYSLGTDKRRSIDKHLHLVHDEPVPAGSFIHQGKPVEVKCCLQIWERRHDKRCDPPLPPSRSTLFEFVKERKDADVAVRRNGDYSGKVILDKTQIAVLSPESNLLLRFPSIDKAEAIAVLQRIGLADHITDTIRPHLTQRALVAKFDEAWEHRTAPKPAPASEPKANEVGAIIAHDFETKLDQPGFKARILAAELSDGTWVGGCSLTWKATGFGYTDALTVHTPRYATLVEAVKAMTARLTQWADEASNGIKAHRTARQTLQRFCDDAQAQAVAYRKPDFAVQFNQGGILALVQAYQGEDGWRTRHLARLGRTVWSQTLEEAKASPTLLQSVEASLNTLIRDVDEASGPEAEREESTSAAMLALRLWGQDAWYAAAMHAQFPGKLNGRRVVGLFTGTGGLEMGFVAHGAKLVMACERDKKARETAQRNHPHLTAEQFPDDVCILAKRPSLVPDHDILVLGSPCQGFSIAGRKLGYDDHRSGLMLSVLDIVEAKRPKVVVVENVKHLLGIHQGDDIQHLHDEFATLGYDVRHAVLAAPDFGVPQARERVFLVAIRNDLHTAQDQGFKFKQGTQAPGTVADLLDPHAGQGQPKLIRISGRNGTPTTHKLGSRLVGHKATRMRKDQTARVHDANAVGVTLVKSHAADYLIGGWEVVGEDNGKPLVKGCVRQLNARESARMQGFPEWFQPHPAVTHARQQFGNAVAVPVARAVAEAVADVLQEV